MPPKMQYFFVSLLFMDLKLLGAVFIDPSHSTHVIAQYLDLLGLRFSSSSSHPYFFRRLAFFFGALLGGRRCPKRLCS